MEVNKGGGREEEETGEKRRGAHCFCSLFLIFTIKYMKSYKKSRMPIRFSPVFNVPMHSTLCFCCKKISSVHQRLQPMESSGDKNSSQMLLVIESESKIVDLPARSLLCPEVLLNGEEVCSPFTGGGELVKLRHCQQNIKSHHI